MARSTRTVAARSLPAPRRFSLESLEARQLMAGNVDFNLTGGNLFITGDNAANGLQIRQVGTNQFALIGTKNGGNTTVQGAGFKVVSGVTGNVIINMNGGNDLLHIEDGEGTFATQPGLPTTFQLPKFAKNLQVNLGAGVDSLTTDGMTVEGRMILDTGFGTEVDSVRMEDLRVEAKGTFGLALEIDTQGGNDTVEIIDSILKGLVDIDTGAEDDVVKITGTFVVAEGDVVIRTQNGDDLVDLLDVNFNEDVTIDTGFGDDKVQIRDLVGTKDLSILLGGGDDLLRLLAVNAEDADIDGGFNEFDALIDDGGNVFGVADIDNFELEI